MRLPAGEFMRRFLLHVLPDGFHRVRHYGLLANGHRAAMLARCRELLEVPPAPTEADSGEDRGKAARREGGGAGLPVLRRADADHRAPAGPGLSALPGAQARRLVTTVPRLHPLHTERAAGRDAGDGSPRHACQKAAEIGGSRGPDHPRSRPRRPGTAIRVLARRLGCVYPGGGRRPRDEPARPIPIGGSSSAVPCNKIFKTPSPQGGSKSTAWLRSSQKSLHCTKPLRGI